MQVFCVYDIMDNHMDYIADKYEHTADSITEALHHLVAHVSMISIKHIALTVHMECHGDHLDSSTWDPEESTMNFPRELADALDQIRVNFQVYRQAGMFSTRERLVVGLGYTYLWSVWDDMNIENWAWKDYKR